MGVVLMAENLKMFRLLIKYNDGSIADMRGDFSFALACLTSCINDENWRHYIRAISFYEGE